MDERLGRAPVIGTFAERLASAVDLVALYCGGSLALGDYRPPASDLDLVAITAGPPDDGLAGRLTALHQDLRAGHPGAAKLHCVYVPRPQLPELDRRHLTWSTGRLFPRAFSGVARAELLRGGITVLGPPPQQVIPPIDADALRTAVRAELTGYWSWAVRRPWLWWHDQYVDLGLVTLARAEAALREDRLITKREAIARLAERGVPVVLRDEIACRRYGRPVPPDRRDRARRAVLARRLMARGIRELGT